MRKILGFVCLAVMFLSSCSKEEMEILGEGTGKLVLNSLEVSASVSDMMSRAVLEENVPSSDDFTITIKSEESSFEKTLDKGVFECILPVGSYTVEAAYGEDVISTDVPYFYGEESVKIEEGAVEPVSVTASLQSAIIHPEMNEELLAQYSEYSLSVSDGESMMNVQNNADVFVPVGKNVTLWLSGTNKLGKPASSKWELNELIPKTRYVISCDADLPSFTFPTQPETNAWSKFMYITPMTAENMSSHPEMAEQVMANIVYEASADGATWLPATYDAAKEKWVIKDLQPNTPYTVRSRFGGVVSTNTQMLTTENANPLDNGEMENWSNDPYKVYLNKDGIYRYYVGASSLDRYWGTRNTLTMDGVKDGSSGWINNQRTAYRWNSCTIPTSDAAAGQAAEIRTMALANFSIDRGAVGAFGSHSDLPGKILENANVFVGYLYTGTEDVTTQAEPDPSSYKIEHKARPLSFSFDYKYAPYNSDNFVVSAYLFDEAGNQIAHTNEYKNGSTQDSYTIETLDFIYDNASTKAGYIYIIFKSGEKNTVDDVKYIEGSYGANPWSLDTFVGSVLKIDNIKLNYEYE